MFLFKLRHTYLKANCKNTKINAHTTLPSNGRSKVRVDGGGKAVVIEVGWS